MRTVPKYMAIISINNYLDETLVGDARLLKGVVAGVGAVLITNPIDALHMEHTRAERKVSLLQIMRREGLTIMSRGLGSNMVAVTIPITIAITITDLLKSWKYRDVEA